MPEHGLPWRLAAPSFVWPGRVGFNCRKLAGLVDEVALCCLETRACLAYTQQDLPPDLPGLGLGYHLHLPLDLPWDLGPEAVLDLVTRLLTVTSGLSPWASVLHPPGDPAAMKAFARLWAKQGLPGRLLLENVEDNDLCRIWPLIQSLDLGLCLDIGHLLAYGQDSLLKQPGLFQRLRLLHAYAPGPGPGHRHQSLAGLEPRGRDLLRSVLERFPSGQVVVLEVFNECDLMESLDILPRWVREWRMHRHP